jgi:ATP-dependent DNA ligase
MIVSAYHRDKEENTSAKELLLQLPLQWESGGEGMPFARLAYALEALGNSTQKAAQQEILRQLLTMPKSKTKLEMYLLLKMMLPKHDHESVYGMKSKRLLQIVGDTLRKVGRSEGSAAIKQWQRRVPLQESLLAKGRGIVCLPELVIAAQCARASSSHGPSLTQVGTACRMLTTAYLASQPRSVEQLDIAQGEILRQMVEEGGLSFQEWLTLVRLLLKKVSMGVGEQTVLAALPAGAREFFAKQHDLALLASMCVAPTGTMKAGVVCGVPFTPMTCHNMRSPYLMRWLFSKAQTMREGQVGAKENHLVVDANGTWYVTITKVNAKERMFVDLNSEEAIRHMPSRRKLVFLLREFQRAGNMIRGSDRVLHFRLMVKENRVQLLLLSMSERTQWDQMAAAHLWPVGEPGGDLKTVVGAQNEARGHGGKTLQVMAAVSAPPAQKVTGSRNKHPRLITAAQLRKNKTGGGPQKEEEPREEQLMVQLKLDGDRVQVHILQGKKVKLFTKAGKDVTALYSNISDELRTLCEEGHFDAHAPCILDGELVVIHNETEQPLPWSSTKWRYNCMTTAGIEPVRAEAFVVLPTEASGTVNNLADEEDEDDTPSFASDKGKLEPLVQTRAIPDGMLRVIVFDMIMHLGRAVHQNPCQARFASLQKELASLLKAKAKHCRVLEEAYAVRTQAELIRLLRGTVEKGQEGLMLKDPRAPYDFGKTVEMQKLKLSGPEINTGVVGIGSSLSSNPRMCGLLTCIGWKQGIVHSYCRVEILQGEKPWKAFERVITKLQSKVSVFELQEAMRGGKAMQLPEYEVRMTAVGEARHVTWKPRTEENMKYECEILIMPNDLTDIQWLVSPYECMFGLSVRGDLRALQEDGQTVAVWKPRNPVGRIELRGFQMSQLDTLQSVQHKFEEAQEVQTCVERHAIRRIAELRQLPAKKKRVLEIARLLQCMLLSEEEAVWPQEEPSTMPTIDSINQWLQKALAKYKDAEKTFKELSPEERLALYNCESKGQHEWDTLSEKQTHSRVESTQEATDNAERTAEFSKWSARLKEISKNVSTLKPVRRECGHTTVNACQEQDEFMLDEEGTDSEWQLVQEEACKKYDEEDSSDEDNSSSEEESIVIMPRPVHRRESNAEEKKVWGGSYDEAYYDEEEDTGSESDTSS